MKRYINLLSILLAPLLFTVCEDSGNGNIVGSLDHDISSVKVSAPEILANGISTTTIQATVYNKDGLPTEGMKVIFEATLGTIDEFLLTGPNGRVSTTLTSIASTMDLVSEVTATVVDTSFESLGKRNSQIPYIVDLTVPGYSQDSGIPDQLEKTADNTAKIYINLIGVTMSVDVENDMLPADGLSETTISVKLRETSSQKVIDNALLGLSAKHGIIEGNAYTDNRGITEVALQAAQSAANDTVCVEYGNKIAKCIYVQYKTTQLSLSSDRVQTPADGESVIKMTATLVTHDNTPVMDAKINFATSDGIIEGFSYTNKLGHATVDLVSAKEPNNSVMVTCRFLAQSDTMQVAFVQTLENQPYSIIIDADPNFIWVKETGNLEQATITATILGITGEPVGNDIGVTFTILNGPGGGEALEPASGSPLVTSVVQTVNGRAQAYLRSGIRSGTVRIRAELVDYPGVSAQTTNIVIRSGPPYMWIDPNDVNNVISRATLLVETGKFNVAFANPMEEIKISAVFGDKYNNPVEEGTAVYFTTTGGVITSDALTNDKGQTSVIIQNGNPFPYLTSDDPNLMTSCCVPNPNDESVDIDLTIPDFEGSLVQNTLGTFDENDGVPVIMAYTWGQDQDNSRVKVWITGLMVYSVGVREFTATTNRDTLDIGESALITIRIYDMHGNPVAAGSSLTVSATNGAVAESNLMPSRDRYGFGSTYFSTQITNNLKPGEDEPGNSVITISLDSPNGSGKISLSIYMTLNN
jgi:hypothetical protein